MSAPKIHSLLPHRGKHVTISSYETCVEACWGFMKVLFPPHLDDRLSSSWLPFSFFFSVFDAFYST